MPLNIATTKTRTPGAGERGAMFGYLGQYDRASAAIYAELDRGQLLWIGVADRKAGIADDLVLGFDGLVVGHQFKTSKFPISFTVETLFTGADGLLKPLIHAWQSLRNSNPGARVEIRLVTNNYPSTIDQPGDTTPAHSAAFLDEFHRSSDRSLLDWKASSWHRIIELLRQKSGLEDDEFERFLHALRVLHGTAADFVQLHKLTPEQARLAADIATLLPRLVTDARDKDRWSREELLQELGWRDPSKLRHLHRFPVGAYVQRNRDTELSLLQAIRSVDQGYVALVGPPGSGKSTLLQMAVITEPNVRLVQYLAYMPGAAQGVGRGEADDFLEDVAVQLRNSGLRGLRLKDSSLYERREQFGALLKLAGERFEESGVRTIIVVDGLDHVPREELPVHSLLAELPLPSAVPRGVTFVLGTQRLDFAQMKPAVRDQAAMAGRLVEMRPLAPEAVAHMADLLGLDPALPRNRLYEICHGHPLVTRYLIHALLHADAEARARWLDGGMTFDGDIESVYASAWREVANDPDAMQVLGYIARSEAPMPLTLLATVMDENAIERALLTARHLLKQTARGWSVFHNSFRLFVLAKPTMRLGAEDHAYPQQVYRGLAQLARSAPADSLQRWLELRYLSRAGDRDEVLALATPERFRQQLAQWRSTSEIQVDIRLALQAVRSTLDPTIVTRLLLCRDEVARRADALEYAEQLPLAMLAVGDIDSAFEFVHAFPAQGYEVVDALLEQGHMDRAKVLFEHLEPLSKLHTSQFQNHGQQHNLQQFKKWARRVYHFRDVEQILRSIDLLVAEGLQEPDRESSDTMAASLRDSLRLEVAEAMVSQKAGADVHGVCVELGIAQDEVAAIMVLGGLAARDRGETAQALEMFLAAKGLPGFDDLPNGWRRAIALFAAVNDRQDVATALFQKLVAPAIAMGDGEVRIDGPSNYARAVMEHAQLCTMLAIPLPTVAMSEHTTLQPLQEHAAAAGVLLAHVLADRTTIAACSVQMASRAAMGYLMRLRPRRGSDFFHTHQAITAGPVLAQAFLQVGYLCSEAEYRSVLKEIDPLIAPSTLQGSTFLRREFALAAYRLDGDRAAAAGRLEPMVGGLVESTPSEQLNGLADLASTFAAIGDLERARNLLAMVPEQCLGNGLAARKDPQYAMWRDVLVLANSADPAQRAQRVYQLLRQVEGMKETEGASSAHRLTMVLINEAAQVDARCGRDVAKALMEWDLIAWPIQIDALLSGLVRRRPDLLLACVATWCGLCLPFYIEPHYRDPTHVGDFIDVAADAAGTTMVAEVVQPLLSAIEVVSCAQERLTLLKRLYTAAAKYGYTYPELDGAISRWAADDPPPRRSYTTQKYDAEASLDALQRRFETDDGEPDYSAASRFAVLAEVAPFVQVREMFERWNFLRSDTKCRFMMVERLVKAGEMAYARQLVQEYDSSADPSGTWGIWMGGGKYRYFHALKLLDGAAVHRPAYESFVDSIVAGQENTQGVLADIDSILPVISAAPDWPAIWSLFAEQMAFTREHHLGKPFAAGQDPLTDEELIGDLLHFALRLPVPEVQQHARNCAQQLADQAGVGAAVFEVTMLRLLAGGLDEPLEGLRSLICLAHDRFGETLGPAVASLVSHRDIAVSAAAEILAVRWGTSVSHEAQPLPLFYQLQAVEGSLDVDDALFDPTTGAMRVEASMGWTQSLRPVAQALAEEAGIDENTVRQRAAMFIQQWGGADTFGLPAHRRLESQLRACEMQIGYNRPHAIVAILALRHVAGELRHAGLLSQQIMPSILERLKAPLPPMPLLFAAVRPLGIRRPIAPTNAAWNEAESLWVAQVGDDLAPWTTSVDWHIVAEVSRFEIVQPRRAEYRLHRIQAPRLESDSVDFLDWYRSLPAAVWLGKVVALDNEPSPTLVRRLVSSFPQTAPTYPIVLCPYWLRRLQWRSNGENPAVYVDASAAVVARLTFWRDAGPVDIDSDSVWGEGCFLALTSLGLAQFTAVQPDSPITVLGQRQVLPASQDGTKHHKTALHRYWMN